MKKTDFHHPGSGCCHGNCADLAFFGDSAFLPGVIGEYVGAIHSQVRKKPFVVIREKINF